MRTTIRLGIGIDNKGTQLNQQPAILLDGNTVGFFDFSDLTTITKDGSELVSEWSDKLKSTFKLSQATAGYKPIFTADGIKFNADSVDDKMISNAITFAQPESIYLAFRYNAYNGGRILDGRTANKGALIETIPTPSMYIYGGSSFSPVKGVSVGSLYIIKVVFNGALSKLQINKSVAITGNFGTAAMDGLTIGGRPDVATVGSKITIRDVIVRKIIDTEVDDSAIYNYLWRKHSLREVITIGDSTASNHVSGTALIEIMVYNKSYFDVSLGSSTIAAQKALFLNYGSVRTNCVFMQIGLNDLTTTSEACITAYQDLVNTIRATIGSQNKIVINTMIPCNRSTDQQYIDLNEAIRGNGLTPITGVDARIDTTLTALNAGDGTLAATYDSGDQLHENNLGRQIIADLWDAQLTAFGIS